MANRSLSFIQTCLVFNQFCNITASLQVKYTMLIFRLVLESFAFAVRALRANLLRTTLSLLGVTIGIFAIIAVFTIVDSLERSVRESFNFLGSDVIHVGKFPWAGGNSRDWWKDYLQRPYPSYSEYRFLKANLKNSAAVSIYASAGNVTVRRGSSSIGRISLDGGSDDYEKIFDVNIDEGRYFTPDELNAGRNITILGNGVAQALFPNGNAIGNTVKIKNLKFTVIGVLAYEGESFVGVSSSDYSCVIPYLAFRKMYLTGTGAWNELGSNIGLKGIEQDAGLVQLENELRGFLRVRRQLKPTDTDNFALNRPEAIANAIGSVFDVLSVAGWIIGGFSILVGGFGIANIMFVSVKERTSIIGLQKALGAKNYFILYQFLFESIFISLIGGIAGIIMVFGVTFLPFGDLQVGLTFQNIILGLGVSVTIGVVSGIVPAAVAARMDPVDAIRSS